jgi:hypothetical protein
MAKTSKKTKKAVEVTTPSIETYLPCEWVIQFDNDVPQIFATADENAVTPEIKIIIKNTSESHIDFTDSATRKMFKIYARPKLF